MEKATCFREGVFGGNYEGGETLEQVAQRSCRCLIIGSIRNQVGWGFEQPDLVQDVPARGRGVGPDDL